MRRDMVRSTCTCSRAAADDCVVGTCGAVELTERVLSDVSGRLQSKEVVERWRPHQQLARCGRSGAGDYQQGLRSHPMVTDTLTSRFGDHRLAGSARTAMRSGRRRFHAQLQFSSAASAGSPSKSQRQVHARQGDLVQVRHGESDVPASEIPQEPDTRTTVCSLRRCLRRRRSRSAAAAR